MKTTLLTLLVTFLALGCSPSARVIKRNADGSEAKPPPSGSSSSSKSGSSKSGSSKSGSSKSGSDSSSRGKQKGGTSKAPAPSGGWDAVPPEFIEVVQLEDRRSLGTENKLFTVALTANNPALRARALLALGRIQDPASADVLVKGLGDPDPGARAEAAFAVGLLGASWTPLAEPVKTRLTDGLKQAEQDEQDPGVKLALLEALGRVGTPAAMDRLTERLSVAGDVQARAALSLGVAAKGGSALPAKALPALSLMLKKDVAPPARFGAAYALSLAKNPAARPALAACAADDASEIRGLCAKGLGDVGTDVDAVALKKLLDDPDYRVAAEATRSLAKLASKCKGAACAAIGALGDLTYRVERLLRGDAVGGGQPLLALAQSSLPASGRPLLVSLHKQIVEGAAQVPSGQARRDMANIECRLAAAIDRYSGTPTEVLNCGQNLIPEAQRLAMALRELATAPATDAAKRASDVGSFVFHSDPRVKLAAIEVLAATKTQASADKVKPLIMNADLVVATAAAAAAARLGDKSAIPSIRSLASKVASSVEHAPALAEALATLDAKEAVADLEPWLSSQQVMIRDAAAAALTKLKGSPVTAARVERQDFARPAPLARDQLVLVRTEKGEFEVKLFTAEAPLTAANFAKLAREGFFRNQTFHRVVPGFVVQGGDPRGDGEGGPGYTLRCEVNHRVYARGVVGMALSGKDTGGSQFFVTAGPQPHLDGRYTAFGEVTKGQEVVDALLEGDKIVEVTLVQ
ncbi:MAG: peptidylprolyl isomerase [Myxococcaceae bacterium]|nr:peptidylprolyl isomerase [Myxococcaceae bacterium]